MRTLALDLVVEAGFKDLMDPINRRIGEVNRYLHLNFKRNPANVMPSVNSAVKFKVNMSDVRAVDQIATDPVLFQRAVSDIHAILSKNVAARLNWWNQASLAAVISAADLINKTPRGVLDKELHLIEESIVYVTEAYDGLITRLKRIWSKRSIWSRIGRRLEQAWTKLKRFLTSIPTFILQKIEYVQKVVNEQVTKNTPAYNALNNLAVSAFSVAMLAFSGVQSALVLVISTYGTPANMDEKIKKMIDSILKTVTGQGARARIAGFAMKTKPKQADYGLESQSFDQPIKVMLDRIAAQIEADKFNRKLGVKIFEQVCEQNVLPKFNGLDVENYKSVLRLGAFDYLYRSPFSGKTYVLSGNPFKVARKLQDDFAKAMADARDGDNRSVAPSDFKRFQTRRGVKKLAEELRKNTDKRSADV